MMMMYNLDNPYFTAGFGLMATGAVLAGARSGLVRLFAITQRRYLTTVEVTSRDPVYRWLTAYLAGSPSIRYPTGHHMSLQTLSNCREVVKVPAPGTHYFQWQSKHWFRMERSRERPALSVDLASGHHETIVLTCLGRQSPVMDELIDQVVAVGREEQKGRLPVYTAFANEWRQFGQPRRPRPLDSVVLARGKMEALVSDIERFEGMETWYSSRGIPYRRGYLLYGPPGCGKSSAIQAIAGHLGYGLAVLSLADRHISDDRLAYLMNNLPEKTILLLEDIDTVVPRRDANHGNGNNHCGLSMSGLLNAIDGAVAAAEARIIIMTTNDKDSLDGALIRPGRIDLMMEIGVVTEAEQGERMFHRFYQTSSSLKRQFGELSIGRSPATLQAVLIDHPDDPNGALHKLQQLHDNNQRHPVSHSQ